jgi:hypothetical protein
MSTVHSALQQALEDLAEQGRRVPCHRRDEWVSDDDEDREYAAAHCSRCPLIPECAAAADETGEMFGVWAGVDRTPRTRGKRKTAA